MAWPDKAIDTAVENAESNNCSLTIRSYLAFCHMWSPRGLMSSVFCSTIDFFPHSVQPKMFGQADNGRCPLKKSLSDVFKNCFVAYTQSRYKWRTVSQLQNSLANTGVKVEADITDMTATGCTIPPKSFWLLNVVTYSRTTELPI